MYCKNKATNDTEMKFTGKLCSYCKDTNWTVSETMQYNKDLILQRGNDKFEKNTIVYFNDIADFYCYTNRIIQHNSKRR